MAIEGKLITLKDTKTEEYVLPRTVAQAVIMPDDRTLEHTLQKMVIYDEVEPTGFVDLDGITSINGKTPTDGNFILPQPDWNEKDIDSLAYIKNKPNFIDGGNGDAATLQGLGPEDFARNIHDHGLATSTKAGFMSPEHFRKIDSVVDPIEIVDNLTDDSPDKALSAKQGKKLFDTKMDKVPDTALMTTEEKNKLASIESGAQANVQPDWQCTNPELATYIVNKPEALPAAGGDADCSYCIQGYEEHAGTKVYIDTNGTDLETRTVVLTAKIDDINAGVMVREANNAKTFDGHRYDQISRRLTTFLNSSINESLITLTGDWEPADGAFISFPLTAEVINPSIVYNGTTYPIKNNSGELVEILNGNVLHSLVYYDSTFFIVGGGSGGGGTTYGFARYQETIFPTEDGQLTFTLTEGTYNVGRECLDVIIKGVPQPHSAFTELSPTSFKLNDIFASEITTTTQIDVTYMTASELVIDNKVDKVEGKGLSTNDFTDEYKEKLDNLEGNIDLSNYYSKTEVDALLQAMQDKIDAMQTTVNETVTTVEEAVSTVEEASNTVNEVEKKMLYFEKV